MVRTQLLTKSTIIKDLKKELQHVSEKNERTLQNQSASDATNLAKQKEYLQKIADLETVAK